MNANKLMETIHNVERELSHRRRAQPNLKNACVRRQNGLAIMGAEDRLTTLLTQAAQAGLIRDAGDDSPASRVARWMAAEVAA